MNGPTSIRKKALFTVPGERDDDGDAEGEDDMAAGEGDEPEDDQGGVSQKYY